MTEIEKKEISVQLKGLREDFLKHTELFNQHSETDTAFQKKAEPIIDYVAQFITSARWADKILKYFFYLVITALTIILGIRKI